MVSNLNGQLFMLKINNSAETMIWEKSRLRSAAKSFYSANHYKNHPFLQRITAKSNFLFRQKVVRHLV